MKIAKKTKEYAAKKYNHKPSPTSVLNAFEEDLRKENTANGKDVTLRKNPDIRMSEILIEFSDPFKPENATEVELQDFYEKATVAWNFDITGKSLQATMLNGLIKLMIRNSGKNSILLQMIEHKKKHFSHIKRMITKSEYKNGHLSVAHTEV